MSIELPSLTPEERERLIAINKELSDCQERIKALYEEKEQYTARFDVEFIATVNKRYVDNDTARRIPDVILVTPLGPLEQDAGKRWCVTPDRKNTYWVPTDALTLVGLFENPNATIIDEEEF